MKVFFLDHVSVLGVKIKNHVRIDSCRKVNPDQTAKGAAIFLFHNIQGPSIVMSLVSLFLHSTMAYDGALNPLCFSDQEKF